VSKLEVEFININEMHVLYHVYIFVQ